MKYVKLSLSVVGLFLIFFWCVLLLNACKGKTVETTEQINEEVELYENEFEGDFDNEDSNVEVVDTYDEPESFDENDDYVPGDYTTPVSEVKKVTKPKAPKRKQEYVSKTPSRVNSGADSNAKFMVIAGSYLLEENAQKMIKKLQQKGYSNAEVIYFDNSKYHSICVGRYRNRTSAAETSRVLKNEGIDAYVHLRQ